VGDLENVVVLNEANKLMLETDNLQTSEENINSVIMKSKKLKLLLLVTVLLLMTSGVYSQNN
jgi:hypothetical protein